MPCLSRDIVRAALIAGATLLAGCTGFGGARYAPLPPAEYQGDRTVTVTFSSAVNATCRAMGARAAPGADVRGCEQRGHLVLPNPCHWPNRSDLREVACHELGHANGWPGDHPGSH